MGGQRGGGQLVEGSNDALGARQRSISHFARCHPVLPPRGAAPKAPGCASSSCERRRVRMPKAKHEHQAGDGEREIEMRPDAVRTHLQHEAADGRHGDHD